jgi:hypothetical protein
VVVIKDSKKLYRVIIRKRGEDLPVGLDFLREEDEFSEQVGEDFIGLDGKGVALEVCHGVRKLNVRVEVLRGLFIILVLKNNKLESNEMEKLHNYRVGLIVKAIVRMFIYILCEILDL